MRSTAAHTPCSMCAVLRYCCSSVMRAVHEITSFGAPSPVDGLFEGISSMQQPQPTHPTENVYHTIQHRTSRTSRAIFSPHSFTLPSSVLRRITPHGCTEALGDAVAVGLRNIYTYKGTLACRWKHPGFQSQSSSVNESPRASSSTISAPKTLRLY